MARYRSWRCPDCAGVFRYLHHPDAAPPPDRCQLCGAWMSEAEPAFIPQAPMVGNAAKVAAVDDVYYGMEDASKARAELMAQATPGASASDFNHTLITDMNDRQKPGDLAVKLPGRNPVTELMAKGVGGWQGDGSGYAAAAHAGVSPHAGNRAREATTAAHHQMARQLVAAGNMGSYKGR